jgi:DNA-binding response OmpR family regulator
MPAAQTILIVEDDATLLRGLKDNFQSQGFCVKTAADGRAGLTAAADCDLILLDIMLPKLNGYELCRLVREQGFETPIIMLTAKGQEEDIVRGLELGADDYVTKPFSIRELIARVRAFLRRQQVSPAEPFLFGDCELDPSSHQLFRQGREIELTGKEYQLLVYFLKRPGCALTRKAILDAVWGRSIIVTNRSVDRCVTTLRSKIEKDPRQPRLIRTIRDIGYRFEIDS